LAGHGQVLHVQGQQAAQLVDRLAAPAAALVAAGHVRQHVLDLGAGDLGEGRQGVDDPLVLPEQVVLGEALRVAVALGQAPGEGHQGLLGVAAERGRTDQVAAQLEPQADVLVRVGQADRLLDEGEPARAVLQHAGPVQQLVDVVLVVGAHGSLRS
jgi:hypothetical protein